MNGEELFKAWRESRAVKGQRDPLSAAAAEPYRHIWTSWCKWLAEVPPGARKPRASSYATASPELVKRFLEGRNEVTQRRYWRVLERIYEFANSQKLFKRNPAALLDPHQRPSSENPEGLVLNALLWDKLRDHLPKGENRHERRDRAILLLFLDHALTPEEVCHLRCDHMSLDVTQPERVLLDIDGKRTGQNPKRSVQASAAASDALLAWASDRLDAPAKAPGSKRSKRSKAQAAADSLLFTTVRGTAMTRRTLFHLVSGFITSSSDDAGMGVPEYHRGPLVLRNTCIVHWINAGKDPAMVVKAAGLESTRGLMRLKAHFHPEVQQTVWPLTPTTTKTKDQKND